MHDPDTGRLIALWTAQVSPYTPHPVNNDKNNFKMWRKYCTRENIIHANHVYYQYSLLQVVVQ